MSTVYGPPVWSGSEQPGQYPPGYGDGPQDPGNPVRRARRARRVFLTALLMLLLGLGTFWTVRSPEAILSGTTLTTTQIAARTGPGLVDVVSTLGYRQAQAAGTGIVLTSSGEVLTNNHVIEGATSVSVTDVGNGRTYRATVVGYDQSHDIAVLQLHGASGLATVTLGDSSGAAVGDKVVALGNAGGKGGAPSVAAGRITGLGASITARDAAAGTSEQLTGLLRHNADIAPGDSGGPLVNAAGQVIGINTAASARFTLDGQATTQGFAVPVSTAITITRQIEAGTASATVHIGTTAFLGVEIASAGDAEANGVPAGSGALVAGVLPGSPADQAGLAAGDVIVSVGGHPVTSPSALQAAMVRHHPGDRVSVGWSDPAGQAYSGTVVLATGPAA